MNFSVRENIILCATSVCFKWQVLWYFWHDAVKFKLLFIFVTAWCWICHLKTSRGTLYTIYFPNLRWTILSYFYEKNLLKLLPKNLVRKLKTEPNFVDNFCAEITFSEKSVVNWKPETKLCVTIRTLRWVLFLSSENIILYTTAV